MERHDVFLIPGFFGFARLKGISYFHHVRDYLREILAEYGIDARIASVATFPTASIPRRVEQLAETIRANGRDETPVHLVGHSTGGLDARLFVTPGMSIPGVDRQRDAGRVRSVTTVATPHYGTNVASFFDGLFGQKLLYIVTLGTIFTLRFGKLPLRYLVRLVGLLSKIDDEVGLEETFLDETYDEMFEEFDAEPEVEIREFLDHIVADRSALGQLTPGSIDLFNAAVADAPEIAYGCVVTRAPGLSWGNLKNAGIHPYKQASHSLFQILRQIAGRGKIEVPATVENARGRLRADFDTLPRDSDSDGVVPTVSQVWGELIAAVRADHLDVCGHFDAPEHDPPHFDWLVSGSQFERPQFERVWSGVAQFIADAAG